MTWMGNIFTRISLLNLGFKQITTIPLPTISPSTSSFVGHILTHTGPFDATTRKNPTLNFFEKYGTAIETIDLTNQYPDFYALDSVFYNTNGSVYVGGPTISNWIQALFGPFERIEVNHHVMRVMQYDSSPAIPDEGTKEPGGIDGKCRALGTCTRLFTEHDFVFFLPSPLDGPGIAVRRVMSWILGPAQVEGQGTDGKQWYEGKVWWDEKVLFDEIARRQACVDDA